MMECKFLPKIHCVLARCSKSHGIGYENKLPWNIKKELKNFYILTTRTSNISLKNALIMGRKTWESIPEKVRPLKGRLNIILTKNVECHGKFCENGIVYYKVSGIYEALKVVMDQGNIDSIFVIGGSSLYEKMTSTFVNVCFSIYFTDITHPDGPFKADTFFELANPHKHFNPPEMLECHQYIDEMTQHEVKVEHFVTRNIQFVKMGIDEFYDKYKLNL